MAAPDSEEMLLNFDGWVGRQDEQTRGAISQHLSASGENRDLEKHRLASMYSVAESTGLDLGTVNEQWDTARTGYAEQRGGDFLAAKNDDNAFYAQLAKQATQQRDERHILFGLDDRKDPGYKDSVSNSLAVKASEAAYRGQTFADALSEWQSSVKSKPGWVAERGDYHAEVAKQNYDRVSAALAKARPVAEEAFAKMSGGESAPFELFRGLGPEEKHLAFRLMSDKTGTSDKSRTEAFFQAIGRGFENLTVGAGSMAWIERLGHTFKAGDPVSESDPVAQVRSDFGAETAMKSATGIGVGAVGMAQAQKQTRPLTAEEAAKWNQQLSVARDDAETAEQLRRFGQDVIDPTNKTGGFLFRKVVLPAADSAALMVTLSIPGAWAPAMELGARQYQSEDYLRLRDEGMAPSGANKISMVSGLGQAALDRLEIGVLARGVPFTRNALNRLALSARPLTRLGVNVAGTTLAETTIELLQDHIIPALAQDNLTSDPNFDVNWTDVWSEVAKNTPDTAMGMVLLSGLGGIAQTRGQSRFVKELSSSPAAMTLSGYTPEQIKEIQAAPLDDRGGLLAQYLPRKAPEGAAREALIAEHTKRAAEEKAAFDERAKQDAGETSEAADYAIRVTRGEAGWQVEKADGKIVTVDSAEAARRIRDDLRQAATQQEADALVSIIDDWHGKAGEASRQTTLTGETARAEGGAITYSRGGEITREIKDAGTLDSIAAEARMDAKTTDNEAIDVLINGQNSVEFRDRVTEGASQVVQRLELNQSTSSALTALHEQAEAAWRTGIATGAITAEETRHAIASIAEAFSPVQSRDAEDRGFRERVQRAARGEASDVEVRETVSELAVADAISKRRDGGHLPAGSVSAALSAAIANTTDASEVRSLGKFRAFLRSAKAHFRAVLDTVAALKKVKREGKGAEFQALIEKITGVDESAKYQRKLADEIGNYVPPTAAEQAAGVAFSLTPEPPRWTPEGKLLLDLRKWHPDKPFTYEQVFSIQNAHSKSAKQGPPSIFYDVHEPLRKLAALGFIKREQSPYRAAVKGEIDPLSVSGSHSSQSKQDAPHLFRYSLVDRSAAAVAFSVTAKKRLEETKVVDGNGDPLRVYHGTAGDLFKQFDTGKSGSERTGNVTAVWGSFFTASPEEASRYAMMDFHGKRGVQSEGRRVIPVFLAIKNPYEMTRAEWDKHAMKVFRGMPEEQAISEERAFKQQLQAEGFDGIVVKGRGFNAEYVAFESGQIVSATAPDAGSFSLSPGKRIELIQKRIDASLAGDPEKRRELGKEAARKLQKLKTQWETERLTPRGDKINPLSDPRTAKQLDKEQSTREALRTEELTAEGIAKLPHSTMQAYDQGARKLEDSPLVFSMLHDHGELLSKTQAAKQGKYGEYDDAPTMPAQWYDPAGGLLPDEMAQMLYDSGLLKDPTPGALWDALRREITAFRNANERFAAADKAVREIERRAKDQAREEAFEWRREQDLRQQKDYSPRARLIRDLRTLDAILSVLPPEIRGKVGGFVKLAQLGSDEARIAEIGARIGKIDALLERYLKKEYGAALKKLFDRAKPKTETPGQKKIGKAGADVHSLFATLQEAQKWSAQEVDAHVSSLESQFASGDLTPEEEAHKLQEAGLVQLVGDWHHADAARRDTAISEAKRVFEKGYAEFGIKRAQLAERRQAARDALRADTGMAGLKSERDARALKDNGLIGGWKKTLTSLLSFEQAMHWTFGDSSKEAQRISDMERKASNRAQDEIFATQNDIADTFTELAGGPFKGEQLRFKMAQKSIKAGGIELSELEAITATLMWRQPDGRRHMEGARDENNKPISAWHYDQAFIDKIESALSPEAHAVRAFIAKQYAGEYGQLNRIYRDLNGINLPSNPNYAPITVTPQQAKTGQSIDPITGNTFSSGSTTPGSLRTRGVAVAEPDFRDALQVMIAHTKQMAHWKAYAPLIAEAQSLLGNRDVGNSVKAKAGEQALGVIRGWLDYFGQGGTRDAAAHLALNQMVSRMSSRAASVALVGRIGTLAIQSTQLAAGIAEMPTGAYLKRMGQLLTGNLKWGKALASPYIQRRLHQLPPIVREAVQGLQAEKPRLIRHAVEKLGRLIGGADALFTAGTFAMVHDYQLSQARALGLSGDEAEAHALNAAERATDRLAQPTRPGARSLFENTATNPFVRIGWAFASEARKNLGLAAYALAERPLAQKVRAVAFVAVLNSIISAMIRSAWRDVRDPGDDEIFDEKHWGLKRMALTAAVDPFQGIPVFGSMIQSGAFKLAGEWRPSGDLFSSFEKLPSALTHIPDMAVGDRTIDESFRDVDAIVSGMGLFNSDIAATASLVHLARDLFGVAQDVKGEE